MLIGMSCLNACAPATYNTCTTYPIAGELVANELEIHCAQCPHTWEWIGRIYKLKQELDLCQ